MKYILNELKNNVINSTRNIDELISELKRINGDLVSVGSGGSKTVSVYASKVLSKKNNINAMVIDPRDINHIDLEKYENIFISSFSGSNYGVKSCLDNYLKKYLLSSRKTNIKDEILLHYDLENEHSFISITSTIVPLAILLKYYLGNEFDKIIDDIFSSVDQCINIKCDTNYINIYSGADTSTSEEFLESSFSESGMFVPLIHKKYSYCHGRSTINKDHLSSSIYLRNMNTDLDNLLIDVLNKTMLDVLVIDKKYDDDIIDEFYLIIQLVYLLYNLSLEKNINLKDIEYDSTAVKTLYYFKGSM